jgi:hypothetical protein
MDTAVESTQGFAPHAAPGTSNSKSRRTSTRSCHVTRDFLATFGPEHLARLPEECRPGRIKGEDDIAYWSCKLAQFRHRDPPVRVDADLLHEMLNYFLHAWVRVSQLHRQPASAASLH